MSEARIDRTGHHDTMNFYKHHIGDYDADTSHLSWSEDMAYTRLMRLYYRREQPIPEDIGQVCRLVRAVAKPERDAVESVLQEFFKLEFDGWHNKRCDEEIASAGKKAERNREVGKLGGRPSIVGSKTKPNGNPDGYPDGFHNGTHGEPTDNPLQTPDSRLQTPDSNSETDMALSRRARLAEGFDEIRSAYPKRAGDQRWKQAEQYYRRRLKAGQAHADILGAVTRYATFVRAKGDEGAEHVKQAATFLNSDECMAQGWQAPPTKGEQRQNRNIDASLQWLAEQEATDAKQ